MPSLEELELSIIEQCSEQDGILSLIRNEQFDEAKYYKLTATLAAYRDALGDQIRINRKLAGCLRMINNTFDIVVIASDRNDGDSEFKRSLNHAHPEILDLIQETNGILGMTYSYEYIDKFREIDVSTSEDHIAKLERLNYQLIARSMEDEEVERGMWTLLSDLVYNDEKYHDFIKRLEDYLQVLGQVKWINRQVAAYFLLVENQFLGAAMVYDRDKRRNMDERIKTGYPKFAALIDRIFDVNLAD